jgi:hypothetical protein
MAGGLHADQDLGAPAGVLEAFEEGPVAFRVVVERLGSDDERIVAVDDAGNMLAFGDVDAAEMGVSLGCHGRGLLFRLIGGPGACSVRNLIRDPERLPTYVGISNQLIRGSLRKARAQRSSITRPSLKGENAA